MRSILTSEQRTALKKLLQSTENKVYSFDKGNSFVVHNNKEVTQEIEEKIGESVISATDATSVLTSKN